MKPFIRRVLAFDRSIRPHVAWGVSVKSSYSATKASAASPDPCRGRAAPPKRNKLIAGLAGVRDEFIERPVTVTEV